MKHAVANHPKTLVSLSEELGAKVDSLDKAVKRKNRVFTRGSASRTNTEFFAIATT